MKTGGKQHEAPETQNKTHVPYMLLLFALLASVGIVLTVFFSFRSYVDHYRLEVERDISSIAHLKVQELTQWREERVSDAETFFRNELFDKDGKPLVEDSEAIPWTHVNTHVEDDIGQKGVQFIDFHRFEKDGSIVLTLITPIVSDREPAEELALLVLQIDPYRFLYPLIQSWPVERETAETLLVRKDGDDVLFLNKVRFMEDAPLELHLPLTQADLPAAMAIGGREGVVEGKDYRGEDVVAALRPVPDSPWFLVAKMDTAELYAPLRSMLYGSVGLAGALLVAISATVAALWQKREREAEHIDLIITDIGLPNMNGKALIMKIKELYAVIPVIAMTGYTDTNIDEALYNAGADIVLKKPYDMDELSRDIRSLL